MLTIVKDIGNPTLYLRTGERRGGGGSKILSIFHSIVSQNRTEDLLVTCNEIFLVVIILVTLIFVISYSITSQLNWFN